MAEIIPAILPQSLNDVKDHLDKVVGLVKKVQVDLVDGEFAKSKTWPFIEKNSDDLMRLERGEEVFPHVSDFVLEADLMILHPIEYVPTLLEIGFRSFVIHVDSTDHINECLKTIKSAGGKVGIGLKPSTKISLLDPYLTQLDFIQFMGNDKIGHHGVELDEKVLEKIKKFNKEHPAIPLQVDIGVNLETVPKLSAVGVKNFVSGSAIFNGENIKDVIIKLNESSHP